MKDKYNFYQDVQEYLKHRYKERVISSTVIEKQNENYLWMQIELGEPDIDEHDSFQFPTIDSVSKSFTKDFAYFYQHELLCITIDSSDNAHFGLFGLLPDGDFNDDPDIEYLEDGYSCFSLKIGATEELGEIIDFFSKVTTNLNFRLQESFDFKDIPLSNIFENIFIFIPNLSKKMLSYEDFNRKFKLSEIKDIFNELSDYPIDFDHKKFDVSTEAGKVEYEKGHERITQKLNKYKILFEKNAIEEFSIGDIGCNWNGSVFGFFHIDYTRVNMNYSLCIVFRPNNELSYLAFNDFLDKTEEGKEFISQMLEGNSPNKLTFIKGKLAQLQHALEDRINRLSMTSLLEGSLRFKKEKFKLRNALTKKRVKYISQFYDEQHQLIEMYEKPLPFVIEKAFRDYVRSDSEMDMATSGLHLLNILIKTRLFFPLEEYMLSDNLDKDFIKIIEQEFYSKKPSDGTFSKIHSILNKTMLKNDINLGCFGEFNGDLSSKNINYIFNEIVSIRNRFAHPPYDAKAFMETLSHYIPGLIDTYRAAMADIDFLIPQSFKTKNKTIILSAKKLMGFESKFETVEITISKDEILNFEVGQFIAYNSKTNKTVLLSKFIDLKTDLEPKYNIGLFDGMQNGQPVYR